MSTTRHPPTDGRTPDRDPHGIIPDGFLDAYGASTIPEALDKAERAPSTTNPHTQPRCPDCGSIKCIPKPGHHEMDAKKDTKFSCGECGHHFDQPAPSKLKAAKQRAAERRDRPETVDRFEASEQAGLDDW